MAPELLGGDLQTYLSEQLGANYKIIVISVSILALLIYTFWSEGGHFFKPKKKQDIPKTALEENLPKIRKGLLESYTKRINSKLGKRFPINVELKYSLEGTVVKAPLYDNYTFRQSKIKEELISIFDKHRRRLLIIGEPGAGKTTLLLQLAVTLIEREKAIIPIIINIATWRDRFKSVDEWLGEFLPLMGFSKSLVELLLKENRILPLFDGLDELAEEKRKPCLEAIGEYGVTSNQSYVICSRIEEYAQTVDAPVYCQIAVRPLTLDQIKKQLKELGTPESNGMLNAINKDSLLAEAIQVPFYLNTTQLLFSNSRTVEEFNFIASNTEGRQQELVEIFTREKLEMNSNPIEKSKKWLSFFAYEMNNHSLVDFELLNLQYSWSHWSKSQLKFASILGNLVTGSTYGFFGAIALALFLKWSLTSNGEYFLDWDFVFVVGLIGGIIGGYVGKKINAINNNLLRIKTIEKGRFRLKSLFNSILKSSPYSFLIGFSIFGSIVTGVSQNAIIGFYIGIIFGIFAIIIGGTIFFLFSNHLSYVLVNSPYQRFKTSMYSLHFSIIQHWYLCYQLNKKGLLPRSCKLVAFLDQLSEYHIMEKGGGSWRFRHRILQDYFAAMWDAEKEELKV